MHVYEKNMMQTRCLSLKNTDSEYSIMNNNRELSSVPNTCQKVLPKIASELDYLLDAKVSKCLGHWINHRHDLYQKKLLSVSP